MRVFRAVRRRAAGGAALAALAAGLVAPAAFAAPAGAVGGADMAVSVAVVGTPTSGGNALFQVTVTNNGPDAQSVATSTGSITVALNSVTSATGVCAGARNSVWTCTWGTLAAGTSATYLVSGKVGNATSVTVNATVQGQTDFDFTNNRASATATVAGPLPDLQLSGSASSNSPAAGTAYAYRYGVKAAGKAGASSVVFGDVLPDGVTVVGATTDLGTCTVAGQGVSCALGDMPGGTSANVVITVIAPPTAGTTVVNSAVVDNPAGDSNGSNNTSTISITTR